MLICASLILLGQPSLWNWCESFHKIVLPLGTFEHEQFVLASSTTLLSPSLVMIGIGSASLLSVSPLICLCCLFLLPKMPYEHFHFSWSHPQLKFPDLYQAGKAEDASIGCRRQRSLIILYQEIGWERNKWVWLIKVRVKERGLLLHLIMKIIMIRLLFWVAMYVISYTVLLESVINLFLI